MAVCGSDCAIVCCVCVLGVSCRDRPMMMTVNQMEVRTDDNRENSTKGSVVSDQIMR